MTRHRISEHAARIVADWPPLDRATLDKLGTLLATERRHEEDPTA